MKMYACAIFDKKVGAFAMPQFFRTKGEATRAFIDAVAQEGNIRRHAEDYVFMFMGIYDDGVGRFENAPNGAEPLMTALDCLSVDGSVN